ncbi:MAG: hypothetical protein IKV85_10835 [Ruminococcus sp.]|nr:hypothetical protein [Ruminococcus sp.]
MKKFWTLTRVCFSAIGGWLGYFLGGCDNLMIGLCDAITPGQYYLCWLGRSNNTHPLVKKVEIMN